MKRLSKSGIEYLDYAWNFYSGCLNWKNPRICAVPNCWAKGITERFPAHYPDGFRPTFYPEAFGSPLHLKKPSRIGVCFMGDLFGDWVDPNKRLHSVMPSGKASVTMSLKGWIFTTIEQCPQHTFLFLTKCPQNLLRWSPFPNNCWVGVTATNIPTFTEATVLLGDIKAPVKYLSIEPLLNWEEFGDIPLRIEQFAKGFKLYGISWLIIGSLTCSGGDLSKVASLHPNLTPRPYGNKYVFLPKLEWVAEIEEAADKAGIPVFLKDNLRPLLGDGLRQEMPK